MTKSFFKISALGVGLLFTSVAAQATTYVTPVGPLNTPSAGFTVDATSGTAQPANISFDLLGYYSLDGINCCTDTFHLKLNGAEIFSGSYNLAGGGLNATYINPNGWTIAGLNNNPTFMGFISGSVFITITGMLDLVAGDNFLNFSYSGVDQGLNGEGHQDEGWGVNNLNVSAVPLPPAALLLGTGFLALLRKRRKSVQA
jgi:hypothetical protein